MCYCLVSSLGEKRLLVHVWSIKPLMWIWSQSEDEDEPAWLSFVIARYLDEVKQKGRTNRSRWGESCVKGVRESHDMFWVDGSVGAVCYFLFFQEVEHHH